jgi:hypothetical protein
VWLKRGAFGTACKPALRTGAARVSRIIGVLPVPIRVWTLPARILRHAPSPGRRDTARRSVIRLFERGLIRSNFLSLGCGKNIMGQWQYDEQFHAPGREGNRSERSLLPSRSYVIGWTRRLTRS